MSLLDIDQLSVVYGQSGEPVAAVDRVSLSIAPGEVVGLTGESGSGKSTLAMAIARLLPAGTTTTGEKLEFDGIDMLSATETELRRIRWSQFSVIFQGAMNALNPVLTVGRQIAEPIWAHDPRVSRAELRDRVAELLESVGIAARRANDYPHQFSGGMKQRAMIAMALACRPKLVIADEPTTALDVMTQAQILDLIRRLADELGLAMLIISHDLSVLAEICDRAAVMYAGQIVEQGKATTVFSERKGAARAEHPYTRRLLDCYPKLSDGSASIQGIPGSPPDLTHPPQGCRFSERCTLSFDRCEVESPTLTNLGDGHLAACHLLEDRSVTG